MARGTPLRCEGVPFDSAMRRKRGSRTDLSQPETSCYAEQNNDRCSVTSKFIDQLYYGIHKYACEILITEVLALVAENSASNADGDGRWDLASHPAPCMLLCSNCRNDLGGAWTGF